MNKKSLSKQGSKNPMFGKIPWNKNLKIATNTGRTRFKKGQNEKEKHPGWKGGKPKCLDCSKQLVAYCAKRCTKCFHKFRIGSNHPNWVNGNYKKAERKDKDSAYMYWRIEVYKRDGYKCKIINKDCKGRIEAHHILDWENYPELRYDINNGITLCHAHHPRGRAKEKLMSPYFMELLASKESI